jgi:hypothetical protein
MRSCQIDSEHGCCNVKCGKFNSMLIPQEFPPKSSLDPSKFGDHTSMITAAHIGSNLEGLTVQQVGFVRADFAINRDLQT